MIESEVKNAENEKILAEMASAYKRLFNCNDGKKVLEDLKIQCGQMRPSIAQDFETNATFFHEGMRNVFLYINQKLNREDSKEKDNG